MLHALLNNERVKEYVKKQKLIKIFRHKKKKWLVRVGVLALFLSVNEGVTLLQGTSWTQEVFGVTLPSGAAQVGTINGAPVIKSPTNDMSTQVFKDIVSGLLESEETPRYIVNQVSWNSNTSLYNGKNLSTFGISPTYIFGREGYDPTDKAIQLAIGEKAYIQNVGSALDTTTGEKVPLSLEIRVEDLRAPAGGQLSPVIMAAKSQSGVITLGWGSVTTGSGSGGGQTEEGGIPGGSSDNSAMWFMDSVTYRIRLVNAETGQELPNDTLMPIKMSDIDASQLATMGGEGAKGYIISPNSGLSQSGNGFVSNTDGAISADSKNLTANSYVVLKKYNTNTLRYEYTDNANNHFDIVTGIFGNTPWDLSDLLGGYLEINKSTTQYGKDEWNSYYGFDTLSFDVLDKDDKVVGTIELDKDGKGKSERLPAGEYTLKEKAGNWASTGQTVLADQTVTVKSGETTKITPKNIAVTGTITVNKSLAGYGTSLPNDLYSFKGLQFKVMSEDGKYSDTVTLDAKGQATTKELPLGKYTIQEVESSVTKATGQVVNKTVYNAELTYKDQNTEVVVVDKDVENTPVLGQITIEKKGVESGTDLWNQRYSLLGNVFKLTSLTDGKTYEITTNAQGVAKTDPNLPLGKYEIEEIKASAGFANTFKKTTVELTWKDNQTTLVFDDATGENQEIKGQNKLEKEDIETGKETQGKAEMATAEYALFYADDATGSSPHKKGDPVKWSDGPKAKLLAGEKVISSVINGTTVDHGDAIVINVDDEQLNVAVGNLALGKYEWKEINAPVGYAADKNVHAFEITKKDDQTQTIATEDTLSKEQVIKARITLQKLAEIVGESAESGYNGIEFSITPLEGTKGEPITIKTGVNQTTDEDGFAQVTLVYGDYVITETKGVPGFDKIKDIYIHMETDTEKDLLTLTASNHKDFSSPFSKRVFSLSDNLTTENPNADEAVSTVSADQPTISLSKITFTDKVTPDVEIDPKKDVTKTDGGDSINHGNVALSSDFVYALQSSSLSNGRNKEATDWSILDDYDETYDQFNGTFKAYAFTDFGDYKKGDALPEEFFKAEDKDGKVNFAATEVFLDVVNNNKSDTIQYEIRADFYRHTYVDKVVNVFTETKNGVKEDSNEVDTNTPAPEPHKFDVKGEKVALEGDELLDDDAEMADRYADSNKDPYVDQTNNNEENNLNTKTVKPGDQITYQLWLDTRPYDETSELKQLQMIDDFDETLLETSEKSVQVYDKAGKVVTEQFKIELKDGLLTVSANVFKETTNSKGEKVNVVDTEKIPFGDYYKIEFLTTVKTEIDTSVDIVNTAKQLTLDSNGKQLDQMTEKRVNPVEEPDIKPVKDVQKEDQGESINGKNVALASDFVYVLHSEGLLKNRKDLTTWVIDDDYDETKDRFNGTFRVIATSDFGDYKAGAVLPEDFFVVKDKDGHVVFTAQEAGLKAFNAVKDQAVTVSIHADFFRFDDSEKVVNTFEETINDQTEKSNEVNTNTSDPAPHKFDLSEAKVDLIGNSLLDDDKEMNDRYKDSNEDPYNDKVDNNEKTNINTKTVKPGNTLTYQLWLDTTPFDQTSELTQLRMVDDYDEATVTPNVKDIHVYDAKGTEVTKHFKIEDKDGKVTIAANIFKAAVNSEGKTVQVIDTERFPLGQIYKMDVPMTVKKDVKPGTEIMNTAVQEWTDSNDTKADHMTEKRVNKVEASTIPGTIGILPKTGSTTATYLTAAGAALMMGVLGRYLYLRKKRNK